MAGSSKVFEHAFSTAFRQWRADSHCRLLHGYGLTITLWFEADVLDKQNWVVDFGGVKSLKTELEKYFDHKTVIATDDPHIEWFQQGAAFGVLELTLVENTGCEAFAELVFGIAERWLFEAYGERVTLKRVQVSEHAANSAYWPDCP